MEKIIEGQNITFSYDGTEVLKGINISISKGKIVGVLGANGAGKSTLLKILCGILNPKIGRILYKSKEIDLRYMNKSIKVIVDVDSNKK